MLRWPISCLVYLWRRCARHLRRRPNVVAAVGNGALVVELCLSNDAARKHTHLHANIYVSIYIYIYFYLYTYAQDSRNSRSLASQQTQSHSAAEFNSNSRARTSMRLCTYGRARATRAHNLRRLARSMSAEVGDSRSRSPHLRATVTGSFESILRSRRPVRQTDRSIDRCERRAGADLRARH